MAEHKIHGRARKLIVAGCLVERYRDEIQKNIPQVDAVLGTGELAESSPQPDSLPHRRIHSLHHPCRWQRMHTRTPVPRSSSSGRTHEAGHQPASRPEGDARQQAGRFARDGWDGAGAELPSYLYDENTPRLLATARHSAYIKIAEGCDHPCAFCIIPQLRGKFRSRTIDSVVIEAKRLASQGVREINLIGQDTTCFGEDLGLQDGLASLLEQLAQIEDLRWIRFLYAYPNKITPRLLEVLAKYPRLCRYIDVPMQHAATPVLKRMKRGGSAEIFLKLIAKMRQTIPDLTLRTSFLVGFPGETKDDFQQLCDFVTAAQFDWLGVFAYSDEEGYPRFSSETKFPPKKLSAAAASSCSFRSASAASAASSGLAVKSRSCSKVPAKRPTCYGKRVLPPTPPRSTAKFSSTISEITTLLRPEASTAPSWKRLTITISLRGCCKLKVLGCPLSQSLAFGAPFLRV